MKKNAIFIVTAVIGMASVLFLVLTAMNDAPPEEVQKKMVKVLAKGNALHKVAETAKDLPGAKFETKEKDYYPLRVTLSDFNTTGTTTFTYREGEIGDVFIDLGEGRGEQYKFFPSGTLKQGILWDKSELDHYEYYDNGRPKYYMHNPHDTKGVIVYEWDEQEKTKVEKMPSMRLNGFYRPPRPAEMSLGEKALFQEYADRHGHFNLGGGLLTRGGQKVLLETQTENNTIATVRFPDDGSTSTVVLTRDKQIALSFQQYKNGKMAGWGYLAYPNGRPREIWKMEDNKRNGKSVEFYPDGMPKSIQAYKDGRKMRTEREWDSEGNRIRK